VILSQLEVIVNIGMPRLKVHSEGATTFSTTLVNIASGVIEDFQHRDKAIGVSIGASNVGVWSADICDCYSYTSRWFWDNSDLL
jgi:hypothetical protein